MKIQCDYCGSMIDENATSCPHCGAKLSGVNRVSDKQPKTIEELQQWYVGHHLPPEEITRFFIGKDIKEPKAFGIYKTDTGDCVVYKNKSTGERAIRYQGSDEAYAVNELYQRLKAEIADQKQAHSQRPANTIPPKKKKKKGCLIAIVVFILMALLAAIFDNSAPNGYYNYKGTQYYHQNSSWYYYDKETDDCYKSIRPSAMRAKTSSPPRGTTQEAIATIPVGTTTATGTAAATRGTAEAPTGIRTGNQRLAENTNQANN